LSHAAVTSQLRTPSLTPSQTPSQMLLGRLAARPVFRRSPTRFARRDLGAESLPPSHEIYPVFQ